MTLHRHLIDHGQYGKLLPSKVSISEITKINRVGMMMMMRMTIVVGATTNDHKICGSTSYSQRVQSAAIGDDVDD